MCVLMSVFFFFFQAEDGIRDLTVTGVQTCALPISGFSATAILTLALGIGANTAIFHLIDAVRLRSLPVPNPHELARIQIRGGNLGFGISRYDRDLTYPLWEQIRSHQDAFSGAFAWTSDSVPVGQGPQTRRARGLLVSGEMFTVLGVPPFKGRLLTADDDRPGCGMPGMVISYRYWQSEFAGLDSAIGAKLLVDGHPVELLRSEEHTSELQSQSISYAVFCLKKKN